jgi:hypothetical protein
VLAFKLCDFLTGHTALHARNSAAASWRYRCIAFDAKHTGNARRSVAGSVDVALAFFFNALLYEVHRVSH